MNPCLIQSFIRGILIVIYIIFIIHEHLEKVTISHNSSIAFKFLILELRLCHLIFILHR